MAVRIRMKRMGRRHRPFFRICVMDSRKPRDGKSIEEVGYYDPMLQDKSQRAVLKMERIDYWISVGAQPSEKVKALIKKVKTNKFGTAAAPPPMKPPKAPPEPEAAAEETASADVVAAEAAPETASEETAAEPTTETATEQEADDS